MTVPKIEEEKIRKFLRRVSITITLAMPVLWVVGGIWSGINGYAWSALVFGFGVGTSLATVGFQIVAQAKKK